MMQELIEHWESPKTSKMFQFQNWFLRGNQRLWSRYHLNLTIKMFNTKARNIQWVSVKQQTNLMHWKVSKTMQARSHVWAPIECLRLKVWTKMIYQRNRGSMRSMQQRLNQFVRVRLKFWVIGWMLLVEHQTCLTGVRLDQLLLVVELGTHRDLQSMLMVIEPWEYLET